MSDAQWLTKHTKTVLYDTTVIVVGRRAITGDEEAIKLRVKAIELDYGPCIWWSATTDAPCEVGWSWDDHPLLYTRARTDKNRTEPVTSAGEISDDTPAIHALLAELCAHTLPKLYTGTDCTHRARLIAALELFWS